jgi:type I restriction enzyme S subunit
MNSISTRKKKPSGDPWFGDVPSEWNVTRLKYVGTAVIGLTYSPNDVTSDGTGTVVLRSTNIQDRHIDMADVIRVQMQIPPKLRTRSGDILICSRNGSRSLVGKSAWISVSEAGESFGAFTTVFRSPYNHFLFHLFNSGWISSQAGAYQTSTIFQLTTGVLNEFAIALPPYEEQRAIADFLDSKTVQIDGIITKKQRMIDLLHEKQKALINEAVTSGLDPDAPTKDACVEWLGRVPRHWSVERLKWRMRKIEQGWSPQCDTRQADPGEWGVLKVGCMNSGRYDESENKALPAELPPLPEMEVKVGDVLMSRSNTIELVGCVGRVHHTQSKILVCDKLYRLVFADSQLDPEYAVLVLRSHSARLQIERDASGASASMKNISNEVVADLVLAFPPLDEQRAIVTSVHHRLDEIRRMESLIEAQIGKLREYRQTLITAVVTGQIDVSKEGA